MSTYAEDIALVSDLAKKAGWYEGHMACSEGKAFSDNPYSTEEERVELAKKLHAAAVDDFCRWAERGGK